MKTKLLIIGGTSGIGKHLTVSFGNDYDVMSVGSSSLDVRGQREVSDFFLDYCPDVLMFLSVYNYDKMVHKLNMFEVEKQMAVGPLGLSRVLSSVLPKMRERKSGCIINFSSVLADKHVNGTSIYSASKAFTEVMIRATALENVQFGITANNIRLGYCDAGLMHRISEPIQEEIIENIPMKRLGSMAEIESVCRFIMNTPYLTGETISLTGGL